MGVGVAGLGFQVSVLGFEACGLVSGDWGWGIGFRVLIWHSLLDGDSPQPPPGGRVETILVVLYTESSNFSMPGLAACLSTWDGNLNS